MVERKKFESTVGAKKHIFYKLSKLLGGGVSATLILQGTGT